MGAQRSVYTQSAEYYDLIYGTKDYAGASERLHRLIQRYKPDVKTLLDVACGTGRHLEYLAAHYEVEGLDINPVLLEKARRRCPNTTFHEADMVNFNLGRDFDAIVCLHSSIGYVRTLEGLEAAIATMVGHLRKGGLLVVEPWLDTESYWTGRIMANFVDDADVKLARMYRSEREGRLSVLKIHYLVGTDSGISHFEERHELGLFTHQEYTNAFRASGVAVDHDPQGLFGYGMYTGVYNQEAAV